MQDVPITVGGNQYVLEVADEFDGVTLNESLWGFRTDSKHWSTQLKENVQIKDGYLFLNVKKEKTLGKEYTGAGLISKPLFKYGYYESRLKIPAGEGWHTSFWLMAHDSSGGTNPRATTIEIDILENDSKDRRGYHVNLHKWKGKHVDYIGKHVKSPDLENDFVTVGCEYTPTYVKYYLDGKVVRQIDITDLEHDSLHIWLTTIASHLGGTKRVDETKLPSAALFDYVRYYAPLSR